MAAIIALAITVVCFSGIFARQQRQHARERTLLINQLLHAAGRPWVQAPADENREEPSEPSHALLFPPDQLP